MITIILSIISLVLFFSTIFFLRKWQQEILLKNISLEQLAKAEILAAEISAKLEYLQQNISSLEQKNSELERKLGEEINSRHSIETEKQLALQKLQESQEKLHEIEKIKEDLVAFNKAETSKVINDSINQLLNNFRDENTHNKKLTEDNVSKITNDIQTKFQTVFERMKSLDDDVRKSYKNFDDIKNSLLSPAGAGNLSEITLANIFRASNLIEGKDYEMQFSVINDEVNLRPDAIVYLPNNNILVVDSKASKFFLQAEIEGDALRKETIKSELKNSMNNHLKALTKKDYAKAVTEKLGDVNIVRTLMFLPTESAIEKLDAIDKNFMANAWKEGINPVGPSGLVNILQNSKMIIDVSGQKENYQKIMSEVKALISHVSKVQEHAEGVGKNLNQAMKKYNDFAGSFNSRFLSKVKAVSKLGLDGKEVSTTLLPKYDVNVVVSDIAADYEELNENDNKLLDG
jgi:DNA recombination protein RmuC